MLYHPNDIPDEAVEALRPAYEHSSKLSGSPEQWVQRCRDDTAQLWRSADEKYWAVSEIFEESAYGKICHMIASSAPDGGYDDTLREEVEQFAKSQGCQSVLTGGRRGWERRFSSKGYKTVSVTLVKEL